MVEGRGVGESAGGGAVCSGALALGRRELRTQRAVLALQPRHAVAQVRQAGAQHSTGSAVNVRLTFSAQRMTGLVGEVPWTMYCHTRLHVLGMQTYASAPTFLVNAWAASVL